MTLDRITEYEVGLIVPGFQCVDSDVGLNTEWKSERSAITIAKILLQNFLFLQQLSGGILNYQI